MRISNPLQMNDWGFKRFLVTISVIQALMIALVIMETMGMHVPALRQVTGLVYLGFIPGVTILRILRLHRLGSIETLVYSVGLSLATVMFLGAIVNTVLPVFGVSKPLSVTPLAISFAIAVAVLMVAAYLRDKNFAETSQVNLMSLLSPPVLFLLLIPFLSILGTYMVNMYQDNSLLLTLIGIIALTVLLIGFTKIFKTSHYPLAIFVIAISLLFFRSLISLYITGTDIHEEYYVANLVRMTAQWDPTNPLLLNGMLSIAILAPVESILGSLPLTWVFKVVYPLFTALIPLALYAVFRKQTSEMVALLACFFFMAVSHFFVGIPILPRQQIATLLLILVILSMIDEGITRTQKSYLFLLLGSSVAVSHYGLSYIFMAFLITGWITLSVVDLPPVRRIRASLLDKIGGYSIPSPARSVRLASGINPSLVMIFVVFALSWYLYMSRSITLANYVEIANVIFHSIKDFLTPETSQGLTILLTQPKSGFLHSLNTLINYSNQLFIIIGLLVTVTRKNPWHLDKGYCIFSILSLTTILAGMFLPFLTMRVDMQRLYHIALIFLAPFTIIGGITVLSLAGKMIRTSRINVASRGKLAFALMSLYFSAFFLFESGAIWQLTEDYKGSVPLSQDAIRTTGDPVTKSYYYSNVTPDQDVFGAKWLSEKRQHGQKTYATYNDAQVHPLTSYGMLYSSRLLNDVPQLSPEMSTVPQGAYVYLQYLNVVENIGSQFKSTALPGQVLTTFHMEDIAHLIEKKDSIYSNGGSAVYR